MRQSSAPIATASALDVRSLLRCVLVMYVCLILAAQGWIPAAGSSQRWNTQSAQSEGASTADPVAVGDDVLEAFVEEVVAGADSPVLGEDVEDDYHVAYIRQQPDPLPGLSFVTSLIQWHGSEILQELRPPIVG